MTSDREPLPDVRPSRWRGLGWFLLAAAMVGIAAVMLFTEVRLSDRASAPGCGIVLAPGGSFGADELVQRSDRCNAARADRVTMALAMVALGGFLLTGGLLHRSERELDGRTLISLALLGLATWLLLWPQSTDNSAIRCGSVLLRTSQGIGDADDNRDELATCAVMRSNRLAWVIVSATAGTLVLVSRRPTT